MGSALPKAGVKAQPQRLITFFSYGDNFPKLS
jgi:hypothetical protein